MKEYIERTALGIGKCNPDVFEDKGYAKGWNAAIDIIQNAPAADVREVVLCRECVLRQYCKVAQYLGADGFCSNGERQTNGAEMKQEPPKEEKP